MSDAQRRIGPIRRTSALETNFRATLAANGTCGTSGTKLRDSTRLAHGNRRATGAKRSRILITINHLNASSHSACARCHTVDTGAQTPMTFQEFISTERRHFEMR
jgi:hypothetical protein